MLDGPFDDAAMADHAAPNDRIRADLRRGALLAPGVDQPAEIVEVDPRVLAEQVEVRPPVALDGPNVLPVAAELVRVDALPVVHHGRQDVTTEVDPVGTKHLAQGRPGEDVHAHAHEVGGRLGRLLDEGGHPPVDIDLQDPETVRIFDGNRSHGDGDLGLPRPMELDEGPIVHLVDVIAGQHEHELGVTILDEVEVLEHGIGRASVPVARPSTPDEGLEQADPTAASVEIPRTTQTDVSDQRSRRVLGQHRHVGQAGVHRVREGEIDDPVLAPERDAGLGAHV